MGTAFSEQSKEDVSSNDQPSTNKDTVDKEQPADNQHQEQTLPIPTTLDASHPRSQNDSKQAFARVAAASENEKGNILSAELASAEVKANINLAQFFDTLEARCETDEERDELKRLMAHRKEEQERWKLAQSGKDPNSIPFPTGESFVPPSVPASSLEWWAGLPSAGGPRDVNEQVFPLRHFEAKGDADQATQEEVPTTAESLRQEIAAAGTAGWVSDELVDGEVVNNKDLSWVCTPPIQGMTEDEVKFLNAFWERRGLGESGEKDFDTELDETGAWVPSVPLNVIADDVTTPDQEAVIKLRETRGALSDEVRQRRVQLLAKHFAEREQRKLESKLAAQTTELKMSSPKKVDPVTPAPVFFEERFEVSTEETTKEQQAKRLAEHEAVIDALAAEGSKYTSFGSPTSKASPVTESNGLVKSGEFPFTSPEAKARVDAIIAKREKERAEAAQPSRAPPRPPTTETIATEASPETLTVSPPPPPSN